MYSLALSEAPRQASMAACASEGVPYVTPPPSAPPETVKKFG
jgi:hypothetical protein